MKTPKTSTKAIQKEFQLRKKKIEEMLNSLKVRKKKNKISPRPNRPKNPKQRR
jgi:hypothetical protein